MCNCSNTQVQSEKEAAHATLVERIGICRECEHLLAHELMPPGNCKKCGCFIFLKARIKGQKCPEGKW